MRYLKLYEKYKEELDFHKSIDDVEELISLLKRYDIPLEKWGKGGYKTVGHLYNEIKEGETELVEKGEDLIRHVEFIGARVIYKDNSGDFWRLYETKQIFKDGRKRERDIPYSVAEKFKRGEDPKKSLVRGIKEELGVDVDKEQFVYYNTVNIEDNSDYPGIKSFHKGYEYLVIFNDDQFDPHGYIENQADKDVYFDWKSIQSIKESFDAKLYLESKEEDIDDDKINLDPSLDKSNLNYLNGQIEDLFSTGSYDHVKKGTKEEGKEIEKIVIQPDDSEFPKVVINSNNEDNDFYFITEYQEDGDEIKSGQEASEYILMVIAKVFRNYGM